MYVRLLTMLPYSSEGYKDADWLSETVSERLHVPAP